MVSPDQFAIPSNILSFLSYSQADLLRMLCAYMTNAFTAAILIMPQNTAIVYLRVARCAVYLANI
jgi:hypothetical protein